MLSFKSLCYDTANSLCHAFCKSLPASGKFSLAVIIYTPVNGGGFPHVMFPARNYLFSYISIDSYQVVNLNPIQETDPGGNTTTNEYDENNNQTSTTDAANKSSAQKVDTYGNVVESTPEMSPDNNFRTSNGIRYTQ